MLKYFFMRGVGVMDKSALAYINEYPALPEVAKRAQVSESYILPGSEN
jgi:hypothetical protein